MISIINQISIYLFFYLFSKCKTFEHRLETANFYSSSGSTGFLNFCLQGASNRINFATTSDEITVFAGEFQFNQSRCILNNVQLLMETSCDWSVQFVDITDLDPNPSRFVKGTRPVSPVQLVFSQQTFLTQDEWKKSKNIALRKPGNNMFCFIQCLQLTFSWEEDRAARGLRRNNNNWKYYQSNNVASGWKQSAFDDSQWNSGAAPLGFASDLIFNTNITNNIITHYFRNQFELKLPPVECNVELYLRVRFDDGVIVYLNGNEIANVGVPENADGNTLADVQRLNARRVIYEEFKIDSSLLSNGGQQILSAELHQSSMTSSDAGFDAELLLYIIDQTPNCGTDTATTTTINNNNSATQTTNNNNQTPSPSLFTSPFNSPPSPIVYTYPTPMTLPVVTTLPINNNNNNNKLSSEEGLGLVPTILIVAGIVCCCCLCLVVVTIVVFVLKNNDDEYDDYEQGTQISPIPKVDQQDNEMLSKDAFKALIDVDSTAETRPLNHINLQQSNENTQEKSIFDQIDQELDENVNIQAEQEKLLFDDDNIVNEQDNLEVYEDVDVLGGVPEVQDGVVFDNPMAGVSVRAYQKLPSNPVIDDDDFDLDDFTIDDVNRGMTIDVEKLNRPRGYTNPNEAIGNALIYDEMIPKH